MNVEILFGKTTEHLVPLEGTKFLVHKQMLHDFLKLQQAAQKDGFDLQIISAFRDYERQLKIWNAKARGERALLDDQERPLNFSSLSPTQIVFAILRWSALPGCSRHHWGTDIDLNDLNNPAFEAGGKYEKLYLWLQKHAHEYGFCQPYSKMGPERPEGYQEEKWHWSYMPLAESFLHAYQKKVDYSHITGFAGCEIAAKLDVIQNYVLAVKMDCR
jgi:LAS superfamily LD-carboxypeptidase LdcB